MPESVIGGVDVGGLRTAYRRAGEGPPVVFLHGFFGDHRVWRRQFELADEYTVVAWDTPGCGASSVPPAAWRMADYANHLAAFVEALDLEQAHLVGNSFGGTVALELSARHPSVARSLVLADTYAGWSGSFPAEVVADRLSHSLPDLELPAEEVVAKWMPGFVTTSAPKELVDEIGAVISDFNPDGMRGLIRALAEADLRDVLANINLPALLIWGELDIRSPVPVGADLQSQLSGSRLVVIPGAGHLSHMEAADRFNAEVRRFLRTVNPASVS